MMPRDLSGNYSRVIPPGASGYQANTDILSVQVNGEINDIGNELTKSLAKDGTTAPTNNLPMANFVHSGMGQADAAGESLRYEALGKGSDIAVTANGAVTLPFEGSLFNLTAASAFNVTGFTGRHDGRPFCVRFNPDKLLTLVNSATFKLLGGSNRIARAGEIVHFVQESAGTIAEVGQQPVIDMTGYSGADVALGVGQSTIYTVTAATSLLLRVATGNNQIYNINGIFTSQALNQVVAKLNPNNAAPASVLTHYVGGTTAAAQVIAQTNAYISIGNTCALNYFYATATTATTAKTVDVSRYFGSDAASVRYSGGIGNNWLDTTTAWTSLGTLDFVSALTGTVQVTRKL